MDKQTLRNELTEIEDMARLIRRNTGDGQIELLSTLIARLAQVIRQEIVK